MKLKELAETICRLDEKEGLSPEALGTLKDFAQEALEAAAPEPVLEGVVYDVEINDADAVVFTRRP